MISPNNGLNVNVGGSAVIPGTYTTSVPQAYTFFNQVMMKLVEVFEPFTQQSLLAHPRFWLNVIPRGAFPNFNGYQHETRVFRGGLMHMAGLSGWTAIDPVPSATNNPCVGGGYTTPEYAWERLQWSGFERRWGSDPICLNQLRYIQQAREQLAWILQVGAEYGISLQEVWNRDYLIHLANSASRTYIMTREYVGNSSAPRFYYNPFATFGTTAGDVHPSTGVTGPFIVFQQGVEIEPLNFDTLDALHEELSVSCPGNALKGGSDLTFGLAASRFDFERYLKANPEEYKNWRETRSEQLIEGLPMGVKEHRGWAMPMDGNQLRFKIVRFIDNYDSDLFYGVGSDLDGLNVVVAQYVPPQVAGRVGENSQQIPEFNPEYLTADLAVVPTLQKNIFTNLMGTPLQDLGSQTYFGPQFGLNGQWSWVNIPDVTTNPEGLIGNFAGKFEIFPKPDVNGAVFATSMLYRRCAEPIRAKAPIDCALLNPDADTGAIAVSSYTASAVYAQEDSLTVTARLAKTLVHAGPGMGVALNFTGNGGEAVRLTGFILSPIAPTYQFGVTQLTGLEDAAVAGTLCYYVNTDGKIVKHETDNTEAVLILDTVEML